MGFRKLNSLEVNFIKAQFERLEKNINVICSDDFTCNPYALCSFEESISAALKWTDGMIARHNEIIQTKDV